MVIVTGPRIAGQYPAIISKVLDDTHVTVNAFTDGGIEVFKGASYRGTVKDAQHEWSWPVKV